MVRVVAPAPFEAAPDAPACASELATHQPRSGSLPCDNIDQYCEVRLAANSTSIRPSPDSSAWFRGAEGRQVLACLPCITDEASEVLDALVRSQHHPDSMRQPRHCGARRLVEHLILNDVDRTMRSRLKYIRILRLPNFRAYNRTTEKTNSSLAHLLSVRARGSSTMAGEAAGDGCGPSRA